MEKQLKYVKTFEQYEAETLASVEPVQEPATDELNEGFLDNNVVSSIKKNEDISKFSENDIKGAIKNWFTIPNPSAGLQVGLFNKLLNSPMDIKISLLTDAVLNYKKGQVAVGEVGGKLVLRGAKEEGKGHGSHKL